MTFSQVTVTWQPGLFKTFKKKKKKKKKKIQETSTYCVQCRKKRVTYVGSTVVPTSSSLEII